MRLLDDLTTSTKPFEDAPLIGYCQHSGGPCNGLNLQPSLQPRFSNFTVAEGRAVFAKISGLREPVVIPLPRGRLDDRAVSIFPTAPHAFQAFPASTGPPSLDLEAPANAHINALSRQPDYPGPSSPIPSITVGADPRPRHHPALQNHNPQSPFHSHKASSAAPYRLPRLSAARLWNPTNSTPRNPATRTRRPSTPTAPPVPLQHLALDNPSSTDDLIATGTGDYPLQTLSEQRQARRSASTRASRVSLPRTVRASYDEKRHPKLIPTPREIEARFSGALSRKIESVVNPLRVDKGKGKATMAAENEESRRSYSRDLERGPDVMDSRLSNVSAGDGIGSAISSSNSSIMGEEVQPDLGDSWGPQHPCYPHMNPHVPIDSAEYITTRIIRIRRDWLIQGDLAPTFSNLYPEILDPAGVSEPEFRRVIDKLNRELVPAFDPYSFRNILDGFLGLATGWLWDDFGMTAVKSRLNNLEKWIEKWNLEMEKTMASEDAAFPPKLVSLRRTGYMTLDIQIPDPEIAPAPSSTGGGESRTVLPLEPAPALLTA